MWKQIFRVATVVGVGIATAVAVDLMWPEGQEDNDETAELGEGDVIDVTPNEKSN